MPLSAMGFLQFIAPTISFIIGLSQGEAFTPLRGMISFAFIWGGVFGRVLRRSAPCVANAAVILCSRKRWPRLASARALRRPPRSGAWPGSPIRPATACS
jgi:hypothetical protein